MHCVDPRVLSMVSVAYTHVDRGRDRKIRVRIENKSKEKIDFESNRTANPNPRAKGGGYSPAPPHSRPPSCGTDPRSPFRQGAAQYAPPLAAGTPGRTRAGSKARRHPWRARRRRAHPPASARAGEQAAVAPPCPLRPATMASGRRLRCVEREGGGKE